MLDASATPQFAFIISLALAAVNLANALGAFGDDSETVARVTGGVGAGVAGATGDPSVGGAIQASGEAVSRGQAASAAVEPAAQGQVPTLTELTPEQKARLDLFEAQRRSSLGRNRTILAGGSTGQVGDQGSATLLGGA